jgi:glyoxylase-like metal-dependent hydrolase (beta-lactamase superfamily II)
MKRLSEYDSRLKGIQLVEGVGLSSNVYIIGEDKVTLIDAGRGDEANKIGPHFSKLNIPARNIAQVVITHAHMDHVGGLPEILQFTSPRIFIHFEDAVFLKGISKEAVIKVRDGDIVETDLHLLRVIHTPGHSMGSVCLYDFEGEILFSGDTVFPGGSFGRTNLTAGDERAMIKSLERLTQLDVDILLPGHGSPVIGNAHKHIERSFNAAKSIAGKAVHRRLGYSRLSRKY